MQIKRQSVRSLEMCLLCSAKSKICIISCVCSFPRWRIKKAAPATETQVLTSLIFSVWALRAQDQLTFDTPACLVPIGGEKRELDTAKCQKRPVRKEMTETHTHTHTRQQHHGRIWQWRSPLLDPCLSKHETTTNYHLLHLPTHTYAGAQTCKHTHVSRLCSSQSATEAVLFSSAAGC